MPRLQTKMMAALVTVMLLLTLVITLASLLSLREFSIRAATEHTRTAAEITLVALTESMVNGTIHTRDSFLQRIAHVEGLDSVRVIRGPQVEEQFGHGLLAETPGDAIDHAVLISGEPVYTLSGGYLSPYFRATLPYIASSQGEVNCLSCHAVPENSVLGAVTLTASIEPMRQAALITVFFLVLAVIAFALLCLFFLKRLLNPLVLTAQEIQTAVDQASAGHFDLRLQPRSQDEIGSIAESFNRLTAGINQKLSEIRSNVAHLVMTQPSQQGDLLAETAQTVAGLVKVAKFKQAIEEDEHISEVYQRISDVLQEEFSLHTFSIYEVDAQQKRLITVNVDGIAQAPTYWCSADINEHCRACRAVRTGHRIDGIDHTSLCRSFADEARKAESSYLCLPILQAGGVGSVIQLVLNHEEQARIPTQLPLIEAYLREAAPVLQAKSLMASLKESTLNDAMTGLRNRRFLEEYSESLMSQCKRRESAMTLMMLDLDYFKTVNDSYGHDVGDQILIDLAQIFLAQVRDSDLVIRYGGEEFLIILLDTPAAAGEKVAEKIRLAVEEHQFKAGHLLINKTLSIGLADFPSDGQAFWQVLKFADVALYAAKDQGRNRVIRFTPDLWLSKEKY
ncbi:diguanylate cyclase [Marinospirillum sp.]|uniref:GGDEF domain-containing protein n=1 Tax=Marinospirillum sp. TaxID=2183934 RepID=UPI003A846F49